MKLKHLAQVTLPAALWAFSLGASAQVVTIGFAQAQTTVMSVPFSPWTTAAITIALALTAWAFLRRKGGTGLLLLALAIAGGGLASQSQDVKATVGIGGPSCTSLTQLSNTQVGCINLTMPSPNVTSDFGFVLLAGYGFIDVVNTTGVPITLSSIGAADGATAGGWSIVTVPTDFPTRFNVFAPTCTVGLTLAAAGRCSLYLRALSPG